MNKMNKSGKWLLGLLLVAIVSSFAFRFNQLGAKTAQASIQSEHARIGVPVEVAPAEKGILETWTILAGTVEGEVQVPVIASNALVVVAVEVEEGDRVQRGDVLIRLAENAPSPMYHSVVRSRASYENQLRDTKRMRSLFDEGAISRQQLDAAETLLKVAQADLRDAEGSTALRAREPGIVSRIMVDQGESVVPNKPLAWIVNTANVRVVFQAGSRQALSLREGQIARWSDPAGARREGVVTRMDLMADPRSHLLEGEVSFDNSDGRLLPGMLVSFKVRTAHREDALRVPESSLSNSAEGLVAWVVGKGDERRVSRRYVQTGLEDLDRVEILDGINEGELVVTYGQTLLQENKLVNPVNMTRED